MIPLFFALSVIPAQAALNTSPGGTSIVVHTPCPALGTLTAGDITELQTIASDLGYSFVHDTSTSIPGAGSPLQDAGVLILDTPIDSWHGYVVACVENPDLTQFSNEILAIRDALQATWNNVYLPKDVIAVKTESIEIVVLRWGAVETYNPYVSEDAVVILKSNTVIDDVRPLSSRDLHVSKRPVNNLWYMHGAGSVGNDRGSREAFAQASHIVEGDTTLSPRVDAHRLTRDGVYITGTDALGLAEFDFDSEFMFIGDGQEVTGRGCVTVSNVRWVMGEVWSLWADYSNPAPVQGRSLITVQADHVSGYNGIAMDGNSSWRENVIADVTSGIFGRSGVGPNRDDYQAALFCVRSESEWDAAQLLLPMLLEADWDDLSEVPDGSSELYAHIAVGETSELYVQSTISGSEVGFTFYSAGEVTLPWQEVAEVAPGVEVEHYLPGVLRFTIEGQEVGRSETISFGGGELGGSPTVFVNLIIESEEPTWSLSLIPDETEIVLAPGETGSLAAWVANAGNTELFPTETADLVAEGFDVVMEQDITGHLDPDEEAALVASITAPKDMAAGTYEAVMVLRTESSSRVPANRSTLFTIIVDTPPVISLPESFEVTAGQEGRFDLAATDADGDPIRFSAYFTPAGVWVEDAGDGTAILVVGSEVDRSNEDEAGLHASILASSNRQETLHDFAIVVVEQEDSGSPDDTATDSPPDDDTDDDTDDEDGKPDDGCGCAMGARGGMSLPLLVSLLGLSRRRRRRR